MKLVTGKGTQNEIHWTQDETEVDVPRFEWPKSATDVGAIEKVNGPYDKPPGGGVFHAKWWMDPNYGLTIENVRFNQTEGFPDDAPVKQPHNIAESLQWRNFRLIFGDIPPPCQEKPQKIGGVPVPLPLSRCFQVAKITKPGRRADGKRFAWALTAYYFLGEIKYPSNPRVSYRVHLKQAFLFSAPEADQEPSASAVTIKVFPTLTVSISSSDPLGHPLPSFGADLKMVFAPRLTRDDQHRPADRYLPDGVPPERGFHNIVSVFCDTNDLMRPVPGSPSGGLSNAPQDPDWDIVFDYAEPEIKNEMIFDAVIYPRDYVHTNKFEIQWKTARNGKLSCNREPGQGEFDNVHIHPYVGFDDPADDGATNDKTRSMIEAPLAADEVIHLHWRWGKPVPASAKADIANHFRGFSDLPENKPNDKEGEGRPLIPANQSLRIKIGRANPPANEDNADPPTNPTPLGRSQTAIWYAAIVHSPENNTPSQFFGQGFGLAYHLNKIIGVVRFGRTIELTNKELLSDTAVAHNYHNLRWVDKKEQRVPDASKNPGLQCNGIGAPAKDF